MKKRLVAWVMLLALLIALLPTNVAQAASYQKGSYGTQVQILQQNLTFLGFPTKGVDGAYGNNTRNAVLEAQKALYMSQTGIVDDDLYTLIKETVSGIQTYLKNKGYYTGKVDGVAGNETQLAFKKLQKELGYVQTGIVGHYILKDMIQDVKITAETKGLREWAARFDGTYILAVDSYYGNLFGDKYWMLFKEYSDCLGAMGLLTNELNYQSTASTVFHEDISDIDKDVWKTVITEGLSYAMDGILSWFGVSDTKEEQIRMDAVMTMVGDLCQDKSITSQVVEEIETAFSGLDNIYFTAEVGSKLELIRELAKASSALSYETIADIVNVALDEHIDGISMFLGEGADVADYLKATIQLYELDEVLLDRLQDIVGEETSLYADITMLKQKMEQDPVDFFKKLFLSEAAKKVVGEALSAASGGLYEIVIKGGGLLDGLLGNASVQEQATAACLSVYYAELNNVFYRIQMDLQSNGRNYTDGEIAQRIADYEFVFTAWKSALETFYESVASMTSKENAVKIQDELAELKSLTYETCINECFKMIDTVRNNQGTKSVTEKMDELYELVGNKYFTVTQKACKSSWESGHKNCENCIVSNVINAEWFTELFKQLGTVNYTNFPQQHYNTTGTNYNGYSCFGFTLFAQYYVYAKDGAYKLVLEEPIYGSFTKDFAQKNMQPGDVIRLNNAHSALVYSVEEDGVIVLESNGWIKDLNCFVTKSKILYSGSIYSGKSVIIDRVSNMEQGTTTNIVPTPQSEKKLYTTTDSAILSDKKYTVIKTEEVKEYGYRQKEYCTGTTAIKDGWMLLSESEEENVIVDWTEQILTANAGETVVTRQVEKAVSKTMYQYSNYYWYTTGGSQNLSSRAWAEKYGRSYNKTVTNAWDYSGLSKSNYKYNVLYSKEYDTPLEEIKTSSGTPYVDETGFQWWQEDKKTVTEQVLVTEYRKIAMEKSYQFYRWSEATGWRRDVPYEKSEECDPVIRTVTIYYYIEK